MRLPVPATGGDPRRTSPAPPPAGALSMDWGGLLECFLASPNLSSREWVYRHTITWYGPIRFRVPGADAAVVRVKNTRKALAMSLDGNGRYCRQDPRVGAQLAVAESCRNLVCSGARPLAATNCLNMGNPEKPEIMWQMTQVVEGMGEACRALGTPHHRRERQPLQRDAWGGHRPHSRHWNGGLDRTRFPALRGSWFVREGHRGLSCWVHWSGNRRVIRARSATTCRDCNLRGKTAQTSIPVGSVDFPVRPGPGPGGAVQRTCSEGIERGLILSAHDCSDGGLAVALGGDGLFPLWRRTLGPRSFCLRPKKSGRCVCRIPLPDSGYG